MLFRSFGVVANVNVNRNGAGAITVNCTNGVAYAVGLGVGVHGGGTVTSRRMQKIVGGAQTIDYGIFSNNGRNVNWGQTIGTDTVGGTGTGAAQTLTAFGRIPGGQGVKPIGGYSDTVQVIVTY